MLACEPRVLVVSRRVRDACRRVAECRSGGLGSGRKPVASMCVSNARPSCSLLVLRQVSVASIAYASIYLSAQEGSQRAGTIQKKSSVFGFQFRAFGITVTYRYDD